MSGFLVARSWAGAPRLLEFVAKRALRLMPALVVSSLACALVLGPLRHHRRPYEATSTIRRPSTSCSTTRCCRVTICCRESLLTSRTRQPSTVRSGRCRWRSRPTSSLPPSGCSTACQAAVGDGGRRWPRDRRHHRLAAPVPPRREPFRGVTPRYPGHDRPRLSAQQGRITDYALLFAAFCGGAALFALRRLVVLRWDLALAAAALWIAAVALGGNTPRTAAAVLAPYVLLVLAYRTHGRLRLPRRMGDYSYRHLRLRVPGPADDHPARGTGEWLDTVLPGPPGNARARAGVVAFRRGAGASTETPEGSTPPGCARLRWSGRSRTRTWDLFLIREAL